VPVQPPPDQPLNVDPEAGVAVRVSVLPCEKLPEHVPGQLIAPPLTVPDPVPASDTVNTSDTTGLAVNVAVTERGAVSMTVHAFAPLHPAPDQPANADPALGVAVRLTFCPRGSALEQAPGQEIPPPVTPPLPLPATETVSRTTLPGRVTRHGR